MRRIIEEVLQAEDRANAVLNQARDRASEIGRSADQEISARMVQARDRAQVIVRTAVEQARMETERLREERLRQAGQEHEALLNPQPEILDALVGAICDLIVTPEAGRDARS